MIRIFDFSPPLQVRVSEGVDIFIRRAEKDERRGVIASVECHNGHLVFQDRVCLAVAKERRAFAKAVAQNLPGIETELERTLMLTEKAVSQHIEEQVGATRSDPPLIHYDDEGGMLTLIKPGIHGMSRVTLANFTARIVADVALDDGAEVHHIFEMKIKRGQEVVPAQVPAREFSGMRWPIEMLGSSAIVLPGNSDHARCAIQSLSAENVVKKTVFAHTGWRQVDDSWLYLHGGGAIGQTGHIDVDVRLPAPLKHFILPEPPQGNELNSAMKAVLDLVRVAPREITVPIIGAVLRSVLGRADLAVHIAGPTGTGKSEIAALAQSFFGADFDARCLPGSWSSTANSLETIAHTTKDAVLVIDDFCPLGSQQDTARLHRDADRIIRAQGNQAGRGRLSQDLTPRAARPPRGLILSTGEDTPRGQSLRARMVIIEIERGSLDWSVLTECQAAARAGLYAGVLSFFVHALAPEFERFRRELPDKIAHFRDKAATSGSHKRSPSNVAQLFVGWHTLLRVAVQSNALPRTEAKRLMEEIWSVLGEVAMRQVAYQAAQVPVQHFIALMQSAVSSGRAHLASTDGKEPDDPQAFGWRGTEHGADDDEDRRVTWASVGERIGWVDGTDVYLSPSTAFSLAQRIATHGEPIVVTEQTLWKRLKEAGKLRSSDSKRETLKVRKMIEGKRMEVLHVSPGILGIDD